MYKGKIKYFTDLLMTMTVKEIKTRYKKTLFGFFWIVLNPVLQMMVIGFVFQYVTRIPIPNYFFFLFAGLLPWNMFSYTVSKNTQAIVFERTLIEKARFPSETIVLSIVLSNAFHTIVSILIFIPLILFIHVSNFTNLLWLFPAILWLLIITSGLSLLLSAINVKYRDVNFFVQALMPLWFYATPILYLLSFLPERFRIWIYLNPMTGLIEMFHYALVGKPFDSPSGTLISLFVTVVIFVLGIFVYKRESRYFVDWL